MGVTGTDERDRWLRHMLGAVDTTTAELPADVAGEVRDALTA